MFIKNPILNKGDCSQKLHLYLMLKSCMQNLEVISIL